MRSLRASVPRTVRAAAPRIQITPAVRPSQFVPAFNTQTPRFYSAPASLSKDEVEGRIVNLLKNFDKVCTAVDSATTIKLICSCEQVSDAGKVRSFDSTIIRHYLRDDIGWSDMDLD